MNGAVGGVKRCGPNKVQETFKRSENCFAKYYVKSFSTEIVLYLFKENFRILVF